MVCFPFYPPHSMDFLGTNRQKLRAVYSAKNHSLLRAKAAVVGLGAVLGYAAFRWGGVRRNDQFEFLLALGLLAIAWNAVSRGNTRAEQPDCGVRWAATLLPAYVLLQAVPLPLGAVRVASPLRAQAVQALEKIGVKQSFAALSVSPAATFRSLLLVCGYVIVFLLVRELMASFQESRWLLIWPIIAIATLEAGLGLCQNLGRTGEAPQWGTYANHNHYAGFLEMALPFALVYPAAMLRRARSPGNPPLRPVLAACGVWALAGVIAVGIVQSLSRMGFIATLGSLFVMGMLGFGYRQLGWFNASRKKRWGAAVLLATLLLAAFTFLPSEKFILRFAELTSSDPTGGGRAQLWAETIPLIKAYPVLGCGLGGYETAFSKFKVSYPLVTDDYAHNDYLQLLAELGLAGFLILAVPGFTLVRTAFKRAVTSGDHEERYFTVACAGSLSAILLHSLTDFNLYIPANAMLLAWIAGIAAGSGSPNPCLFRDRASTLPGSPGRQLKSILAVRGASGIRKANQSD